MKFKKYFSLLIPIILLTILGCDDDSITINSTGEVIVINEGNFTDSDGSLSTIDVATSQVINNAFSNINGRARSRPRGLGARGAQDLDRAALWADVGGFIGRARQLGSLTMDIGVRAH